MTDTETPTSLPTIALVPWEKNPRKNDAAVDKVAQSIQELGFGAPIVAQAGTNRIIAGHTRWKAAQKLGLDEALVGILDDLDDSLVDTSGFSDFSLPKEREKPSDNVPEPPAEPITQLGDVWKLGEHRLLCGSCEELPALMAEKKADMIATDPPYGVGYGKKQEALNKADGGSRNTHDIKDDELPPEEMSKKWEEWFSVALSKTKKGGAVYVCGPSGAELFSRLCLAIESNGVYLPQHLVWLKNQMVLGRSDYHGKHENIAYGWKKGASHLRLEDRTQTTVWEYDKPEASKQHPTMKPVALMQRMIENSSKPGEIVLEPFCGSGTTLLAAEASGRRCYATELSPAFCDVIVARWEEYTGRKAERVSNGS